MQAVDPVKAERAERGQILHRQLLEGYLLPFFDEERAPFFQMLSHARLTARTSRPLGKASISLRKELLKYIEQKRTLQNIVFPSNFKMLLQKYQNLPPDVSSTDVNKVESLLIREADSVINLSSKLMGVAGEAQAIRHLDPFFSTYYWKLTKPLKSQSELLQCSLEPDFQTEFTLPENLRLGPVTQVFGEIKVLVKSWRKYQKAQKYHLPLPDFEHTLRSYRIFTIDNQLDLVDPHSYLLQTVLYAAHSNRQFADLALVLPQGIYLRRITVDTKLKSKALELFWRANWVMAHPPNAVLWRFRQDYAQMRDLLQLAQVHHTVVAQGTEVNIMVLGNPRWEDQLYEEEHSVEESEDDLEDRRTQRSFTSSSETMEEL